MSAAVLGRLLRSPEDIAGCCREDRETRAIARTSLAALVAGAAIFGGVIGSFRGGWQIAYAAIKIPLAIVATLAVAAPAFHAVAAAFGRPWPMRSILSLTLAAAGRAALVLLALAPALWLVFDWGLGYHAATLASSLAYGVAGIAAASLLVRGLGPGEGRAWTALSFVAIFFAVGAQTSWILRPYLVRPRTQDVPFLRAREGGFADAITRSARSSVGLYDRENADAPGRIDPRFDPDPEIDGEPRRGAPGMPVGPRSEGARDEPR